MISEPELVDGSGFDAPDVLTDAPPPRPPRARRPWPWALGGALLASAVWAGGLYAYGQKQETGPDLAGYAHVENLCEAAELKALTAALGDRGQDGTGFVVNEPEISESSCMVAFGPANSGLSLDITYTLHKVVDPGPEFAVRAEQFGVIQAVGGIGERAFFDDQGGEGGTLRVLDGQAEFLLNLNRSYSEVDGKLVETAPVDLTGIDVPMIQDTLALMAALKK
ncbi:hypothetical protein [Streptomyces sp. NPDC003327]